MRHKFLPEDYEALLKKRDDLVLKLQASGKDIGEANTQSSETWHDNAPLDVAQREFERLSKLIEELEKVIRQAEVVHINNSASAVVSLGSEVTFVDQDGKEQAVKIGSHTPKDGSPCISYKAPIADLLLGHREGDVVEGTLVNRKVELEILKIVQWA